jgi:hypothetical protein
MSTFDLDELDRGSRQAVNDDIDGTMTLPTQHVRELVARLRVSGDLARYAEKLLDALEVRKVANDWPALEALIALLRRAVEAQR